MFAFGSASSRSTFICEQVDGFCAAEGSRNQKPFDVFECIRFCLNKWVFIVVSAVLCAIIACVIHAFVPPVYEATSKLYILAPQEDGVQTADLQAGSMLLSDYREVLKTWEFHHLVQQQVQMELSYQQLQGMLSVETPDDTRLVYITIRHPDAALACELANACAQAARVFIEENLHGLQPSTFSTAIVPGRPAGFSAVMWTALAFAAGALLAAVVLVVVFCLDDCIRTENELKLASGLAVLADEQDTDGRLLASRLISRKARCVLITGEGCVSRQLLGALATLHRRTVLICVEHGDDPCEGIAAFLEGHCAADDLLQATESPNGSLLPIRASEAELPRQLFHPQMAKLISVLQNMFDIILIDAASPERFADASAFFPFCDGVVLTAVRAKSRMKTLSEQAAVLAEADCRMLGAVFATPAAKKRIHSAMRQGASV